MAYTITWNDGTAHMIDLGNVEDETGRTTTKAKYISAAGRNADEVIPMDTEGNMRSYSLEGAKSGTANELETFILACEGLIDCRVIGTSLGGQWRRTGAAIYRLNVTAPDWPVRAPYIFVEDFIYNKRKGEPGNVYYTIKIVERKGPVL